MKILRIVLDAKNKISDEGQTKSVTVLMMMSNGKIHSGIFIPGMDIDGRIKRICESANAAHGLTDSFPDFSEVKLLLAACYKIEFNQNIIVDGGTVMLKDKVRIDGDIQGTKVSPLQNPNDVVPNCTEMQEICTIVHTPEVKQACIDAQPPKQKTVKVMKPYSRVEVIDGVPTLKTGEEEVDEPMFEEIPVVDEAGNPAMQLVSETVEAVEAVVAVVDEETGDEISPAVEAVSAKDAVYAQITHKVPVME